MSISKVRLLGGGGNLDAAALSLLYKYLHGYIVNYLSRIKYLFNHFFVKYSCLLQV